MWKSWRFRGNEASEFFMSSLFDTNLELSFEIFHPISHEMDILEHDPIACSSGFFEGLESILFLTLSHGNVDEFLIGERFSNMSSNEFDFRCWINTREEYEEGWSLWVHFFGGGYDIEWRSFNVFSSHFLSDEFEESVRKSIWSDCSQ